MVRLEPLFKTTTPLKLKQLSGKRKEEAGFKQVIVNGNDKILIGRNHSYGVPKWFEEIVWASNKLFKEGVNSVEIWVIPNNSRGVVVGIKNGITYDLIKFGNISDNTLNSASVKFTDGYKGFKKWN